MVECRACGEVYYVEPERVGARCRRCREPLYERREAAADAKAPVPDGPCATHPRSAAVAACHRCGALVCAVCRTRWHDSPLCPACVGRAMEEKEVRPEDVRLVRRQAVRSLIAGGVAWAMTALGFLLPLLFAGRVGNHTPLILAGLLGVTAFLPSLFGVGQAVAALRDRGPNLRPATVGLTLCGTHIGIVFGLALMALWQT